MQPGPTLILLHDSPLRVVNEAEALASLTAGELSQPRRIERIDTRHLADDINGGHWRSSHTYLREAVSRIRAAADEIGAVTLKYFGIAEVPHVIALGAYMGDERLMESRDYDRDRNRWAWRADARILEIDVHNLPREAVTLPGPALVRVEISYPVQDDDVDAVVGRDRLADIRISPKGRAPTPGIVQSFADVQEVRAAVRAALVTLASMRPNLEVVHLFVAGPVSVCLAVGQELRLRNGKDVQTYRYRPGTGAQALTPAMLLTNGEVSEASAPLAAADRERAERLRPVWQAALAELQQHARVLQAEATSAPWHASLRPTSLISSIAPFPGLKPIWQLIAEGDRVSPAPAAEFAFTKEPREWRLNDELILAMFEAASRDEDRLRAFARLFFWHEYVHDWQGVTTYTSPEIGQLANCLERADYLADAYAIFHQIDFLARAEPEGVINPERLQAFLVDQVGVALRSFWAFERNGPLNEMQERRLRRYLNWYWRRVQLRDAPNLRAALRLLARQPCIEVSGLRRKMGGGNRVNVAICEPQGFDRLHIGIVLEDGRLERRGSSTDASIEELMRAFSEHDHEAIERFFNALIDHVKHGGGAFPLDEPPSTP